VSATVASESNVGTGTTIVVVTGQRYTVDGSPQEVETAIVAASRGSIMQLAWLSEAESGRAIAINPSYLVALEEPAP